MCEAPEVLLRRKFALRRFYEAAYQGFARALARAPADGAAVELGAGHGFARELLDELIATDVVFHARLDLVADATRLPFRDRSLRLIAMLNVLHHIPDVWAFLAEARRCLVPGGRIRIVDQHVGLISYPVLRFGHDEHFDMRAPDLRFAAGNPERDANGAMAWLLFRRERARLAAEFPELEVVSYRAHSPLIYWLSGGLKRWSLVGRRLYPVAHGLDRLLTRISPAFGSFCDIEMVRRGG